MAKKSGYYRANQGFATVLDGENVFVKEGEFVPAGHPLLKGRDDLFEPATSFGRWDNDEVEQATAAPGEKRGRPKKKAAPKKPEPKPEPEVSSPPAPEPTRGHFGLRTSDIGGTSS
jgi:pyruvate/2-oxoglutarate dehydrogenase complex dihydrolipoamide acyltransferase (E2) component